MESYPNQPNLKYLAEVKPIGDTEGELLRNHEDIQLKVEQPAVNTITDLWDKNIGTVSSSANAKNGVYVDVDWGSLSEENRQIATGLGLVDEKDLEPRVAHIAVDFDPDSSVDDIEKALKDAVSGFKHQPLTWAPKYTLEQMKTIYGYGDDEDLLPEEIEEYYFAPDGMFHLSEELYMKSLENNAIDSQEAFIDQPQIFQMSAEQFKKVSDSVDSLHFVVCSGAEEAIDRTASHNFDGLMKYSQREDEAGENTTGFRIGASASLLGALPPRSANRQIVKDELKKHVSQEVVTALENFDNHIRSVVVRSDEDRYKSASEFSMHINSGVQSYAHMLSPNDYKVMKLILLCYGAGGARELAIKNSFLTQAQDLCVLKD